MSHQKHFSTMAAAVVPRPPWCHPACTEHATTNQDHRPSFLSGEAWQVALGCRYGSQRTPWWGGCRQDDLASNLRSKGKKIARSPIFYVPFFDTRSLRSFCTAKYQTYTLKNKNITNVQYDCKYKRTCSSSCVRHPLA